MAAESSRGHLSSALWLGDGLVWLAFTLGGMRFHNVTGSLVGEALRIGAPFLVGYFVSAWLLGALTPTNSGRQFGRSSALAWLVGTGLGVLLRMVVEGRTPVGAFVAVTFAFSGVLLLGWRLLYWRLRQGRP